MLPNADVPARGDSKDEVYAAPARKEKSWSALVHHARL
jgi:hypothetical protein